eukprot:232053_1
MSSITPKHFCTAMCTIITARLKDCKCTIITARLKGCKCTVVLDWIVIGYLNKLKCCVGCIGLSLLIGVILSPFGYYNTIEMNKNAPECNEGYIISPCIITSMNATNSIKSHYDLTVSFGPFLNHSSIIPTLNKTKLKCNNPNLAISIQTQCIGYIDSCLYNSKYELTLLDKTITDSVCDDPTYYKYDNRALYFWILFALCLIFILMAISIYLCMLKNVFDKSQAVALGNLTPLQDVVLANLNVFCWIFTIFTTTMVIIAAVKHGIINSKLNNITPINDIYSDGSCWITNLSSLDHISYSLSPNEYEYKTIIKYESYVAQTEGVTYQYIEVRNGWLNSTQNVTSQIGNDIQCFFNKANRHAQLQQPSNLFLSEPGEWFASLGDATVICTLLWIFSICSCLVFFWARY